jgi:hypothetical protein
MAPQRERYNMSMNHILEEVRLTADPADAFGEVQSWRFSLAKWLTDAGVTVPDFRGSDDIRDDYAYGYLEDSFPSVAQARYALKILDRAREIIRAEGLDY